MLFQYFQSVTLNYNKAHRHLFTYYLIMSLSATRYHSCSNVRCRTFKKLKGQHFQEQRRGYGRHFIPWVTSV